MSDPILLHIDDGLARITLNRPDRLNAFDGATAHAWRQAVLDATTDDGVGAILIDANGPGFCAGGDVLAMAGQHSPDESLTAMAEVINAGIRSLLESSIPVVAAAHGTTAGGGLGILLASDYAVVAENSRIGSLYSRMGLTPDLSVTAQLSRAVGERRALELVLIERLLTASEALAWGLVAEVVPADAAADTLDARVKDRGEEIARTWLAGATSALGQAKRLIRSSPSRSLPDQLTEEARTIGQAVTTTQARERIAAFAAKGRASR